MWVTFNFSITFQTGERMVFQLGTLSVSPSGLFSRALGWEPCDNGVFFRVEWLWEKLPLLFRHFLFFSYKWERDWWRQQQKKNNYRQWESTTTQTLHGLIILGRGLETSLFRLIHLWGDIPPDTGRKTVTLDMGWHAEPLLTVPTQHDAPKLKQERKLLILIFLTAGAGTMIFHISWGEKRGAVTCFFSLWLLLICHRCTFVNDTWWDTVTLHYCWSGVTHTELIRDKHHCQHLC